MIDDSALLHGRVYDPVKAREYYLRTRKLKGRQGNSSESPKGPRTRTAAITSGRKSKAKPTSWKSHRQQVAALEARLETLKRVLANLVEEAKKRSGVETKSEKAAKSSTSEKSSSSKSGGGEKRTAEQKRKDAERQKEYREKQKPELDQLRAQIQDIREKIQEALEEAREREAARKQRTPKTSKPQTASKGR